MCTTEARAFMRACFPQARPAVAQLLLWFCYYLYLLQLNIDII